GERYERAIAAADSITVTSDHYARGSSATFDYANLVLTGMGRLRAETLDAPLRALAVWDPQRSGAVGGSSSNVLLWQRHAMTIDFIDVGEIRGDRAGAGVAQTPAKRVVASEGEASHQIRAMLFADAVGYSKLTED